MGTGTELGSGRDARVFALVHLDDLAVGDRDPAVHAAG
jgi:hypothetical protein